jgi:hypothetical protein
MANGGVMRKLETRLLDVRIEVVTTTFVASGRLESVHDMGRFVTELNSADAPPQIELHKPAIRPLYRATNLLHLDAPLLVARNEIVFANFEGPYVSDDSRRYPEVEAPALLLAPPFQIQGTLSLGPGIEMTQALRTATQAFFAVRRATVYDADGNILGEGDQIIVNGHILQMACLTRQHIDAVSHAPAAIPEEPEAATGDLRERSAA